MKLNQLKIVIGFGHTFGLQLQLKLQLLQKKKLRSYKKIPIIITISICNCNYFSQLQLQSNWTTLFRNSSYSKQFLCNLKSELRRTQIRSLILTSEAMSEKFLSYFKILSSNNFTSSLLQTSVSLYLYVRMGLFSSRTIDSFRIVVIAFSKSPL